MTDPSLERALCDAIQDGRLRQVLAELRSTAGSPRNEPCITTLSSALAQIDEAVGAERKRLSESFDRAGITTASIDDDEPARPLRVVRVRVGGHDVDRAVETLAGLGYRRLAPVEPGPWRAYRSMYGGCAFVATGSQDMRTELSWPVPRALTGPLARLLVPVASDFDVVALPRRFWFGYIAIHFARLPLRLLRRRTEPPYLGPFLVTPVDLIEPLLDFAGARPADLVVDLGCGDGRIPVAAARLGCRARGVESDAALVRDARSAVSAADLNGEVVIEHGDATRARIVDADVVVMFLPVATLEHLLPSVLGRLAPGARLVVHEQERLRTRVRPDRSTPLATAGGITVAHRWDR